MLFTKVQKIFQRIYIIRSISQIWFLLCLLTLEIQSKKLKNTVFQLLS